MLKTVHSSFHGRDVKFGRHKPSARPKMHLKNYLKALPAPPPTSDYAPKGGSVLADIMLNDQLGDCVIAGAYHVVGVETGNATGAPYHATKSQIISDYSAIGGYKPGQPSTDQGCDIPKALKYWQSHGFANGTKLLGSIAVDATDKNEVMLAMYLFENLYFGVALPDKWITPFPSGNGFVWDVAGAPDLQNGHCFVGVGHDAVGVHIDTWGMIGTVTYAAIAKYCTSITDGELHVLLTPDQLAKGQSKAPNGIDWSALLSDFNSLGGNVPVPAPVVTPPVVVPALSLDAVQKLLAGAWPHA